MITETRGSAVHAYGYDWEDRMTLSDFPGAVSDTVIAYDALGRRVSKSVNGTVTQFLHDGNTVIADYDSSGAPLMNYVNPLGELLVISRNNNADVCLGNGFGSIYTIIDSACNIVNYYDYTPSGGTECAGESFSNRFRFAGMPYDTEVDAGDSGKLTARPRLKVKSFLSCKNIPTYRSIFSLLN